MAKKLTAKFAKVFRKVHKDFQVVAKKLAEVLKALSIHSFENFAVCKTHLEKTLANFAKNLSALCVKILILKNLKPKT